MGPPDPPRHMVDTQFFSDSKFGVEAVERLHVAFDRSRNPMLIVDDQRRWVTGNVAACNLLGIGSHDVPWHSMDEFTPPGERARLDSQWRAFLANGAAEGWYLSLIHISEPTRRTPISYAVFCL